MSLSLAVETPAVVVDIERFESNVARMASAAAGSGIRLRPHIKAHKLPELARVQLEHGAIGLTCATLSEAEVMVEETSCTSLTIAYPVLGTDRVNRLKALRERVEVRVALDSGEVAQAVAAAGSSADPVPVLLEVDCGHGRLGRPPGAPSLELAKEISRVAGVRLIGVTSHAGHAYAAKSESEIRAIAEREATGLAETAALMQAAGIDAAEISVGSTPSTHASLDAPGVTEVRPGTYALNDINMVRLGAATESDCAVHVIATVVSTPTATRFVVDAGTKVLSSDGVGITDWTRVDGRPDLHPSFLSEEHGVFTADDAATRPRIGGRLAIIPAHVCTTMNLADTVTTHRAGALLGELTIRAKRRSSGRRT
jgi:D-serine deaminase-like pyridoxal phosphate-dependent protein